MYLYINLLILLIGSEILLKTTKLIYKSKFKFTLMYVDNINIFKDNIWESRHF